MDIKTGNSFLDQSLSKDNRTIGFFDSPKSLPKSANEGNRAIIINGNTREYINGKWTDLETFIAPISLPGERGEQGIPGKDGTSVKLEEVVKAVMELIPIPKDGVNGKDGKDGESVNEQELISKIINLIVVPKNGKDGKDGKDGVSPEINYDYLVNLIINKFTSDKNLLSLITGKAGDNGKDGKAPSIKDIVAELINNESFLTKVTVVGPAGQDGVSPEIKDILFAIKNDKDFIKQCTVVGPQGPVMKFEDLTAEQIKLITGPAGEGLPGPMGPQGLAGDRVFIQYSPDGETDWSYKLKDGDKFILIQVGRQTPQIAQFIFN